MPQAGPEKNCAISTVAVEPAFIEVRIYSPNRTVVVSIAESPSGGDREISATVPIRSAFLWRALRIFRNPWSVAGMRFVGFPISANVNR
jgi:hypothetical protein